MNSKRVYDLLFVPNRETRSRLPEIVVSINNEYVDLFHSLVADCVKRDRLAMEKYLGSTATPLFKKCWGVRLAHNFHTPVTFTDSSYEVHFPLYNFLGPSIAVALYAMTAVLNALMREPSKGEAVQEQLLEIHTSFGNGPHAFGLGGYVHRGLGTWLRTHATADMGELDNSIVEALQETWRALAQPATHEYADDCAAFGFSDGRFVLTCFGNACDVAIYPDNLSMGILGETTTSFSSRHVDTHHQQLTLIAGLAQMVTLARREAGEK